MIEKQYLAENRKNIKINFIGNSDNIRRYIADVIGMEGIFNDTNFICSSKKARFKTIIYGAASNKNIVELFVDTRDEKEVAVYLKNMFYNNLNKMFLKRKSNIHLYEILKYFLIDHIGFDKDAAQNIICKFNNVIICRNSSYTENENIKNLIEYIVQYFLKLYYIKIDKIKEVCRLDDSNKYVNENNSKKFNNHMLKETLNILYKEDSISCICIKHVYIKIPVRNQKYFNKIFTEFTGKKNYIPEAYDIKDSIIKNFKEIFVFIIDDLDNIKYTSLINNMLNKVTLVRRIFCIIYNREKHAGLSHVISSKMYDNLKIDRKKIYFIDNDYIKKETAAIDSIINYAEREDYQLFSNIKILMDSSKNDEVIKLKLNKEKLSVQTMMNILYAKINVYLNMIFYKIQDRNISEAEILFLMKNGELDDIRRLLGSILINGENSIGINDNNCKVIVEIDGKILNGNKLSLLNNIKARFQENIIYCFEKDFIKILRDNIRNKSEKIYFSRKQFSQLFNNIFKNVADSLLNCDVRVC